MNAACSWPGSPSAYPHAPSTHWRGQSATAALVHVAKRVVATVYAALERIASEWGTLGCAEDDEPVFDADVLARPSVAAAMREVLAALPFPEPAPLLHEMQAEFMLLDTADVQAVDLAAKINRDLLDDFGPDPTADDAAPPTIPMREAAKRTAKGRSKKEDDPEPLPSERPGASFTSRT